MTEDSAKNRASKVLDHLRKGTQSTNQSTSQSSQPPANQFSNASINHSISQSTCQWLSLSTDEVRACVHSNGLAELILNRPKSLNALTTSMVTAMLDQLTKWDSDDSVKIILVSGLGKAFCAGGDLKALLQGGLSAAHSTHQSTSQPADTSISSMINQTVSRDDIEPNRFLRNEYTYDLLTTQLSKPYVSICHGMTVGGGIGISMHGLYRVVCEDTRVAMPEVLIGLIPDVGGSYFLSRFPGEAGMFCGLTGHYLDVADQMYVKAATHFVPRSSHDSLFNALRTHNFSKSPSPIKDLNNILERHHCENNPQDDPSTNQSTNQSTQQSNTQSTNNSASFLQRYRREIDDLFSGHSLESIKLRIASVCDRASAGSPDQPVDPSVQFALLCREKMKSASPTSLLLTFEAIRRGRRCSLAECLLFEYRIVVRCGRAAASGGDFYEGVRAKILEKDNLPKWNRPIPLLHVHDMFLPLHAEGPDLVFTESQLKRSDITRR